MAQGKRQVRGRRGGQERSLQIFEVCMSQRRHDSRGKRLRTFDLDELAQMNANELAAVKRDGWTVLPDMITMHGPLGFDKDGNETPCPCEDCETARADWRDRTGIE